MPGIRDEVGLIGTDNCSHVVLGRLSGLFALCDQGRIVKRLPGAFDPKDPLACAHCVQAAAQRPRR